MLTDDGRPEPERIAAARQLACQALARLEGPESTRLLVRALSGPSADGRCLAADALWRRGAHEAEADLRIALARETDGLARDYLEDALGRLGRKYSSRTVSVPFREEPAPLRGVPSFSVAGCLLRPG